MLANEIIAHWVEQHGKAPWVSEGDEVGFSWIEVNVQDAEKDNLFASNGRLVDAIAKRGV